MSYLAPLLEEGIPFWGLIGEAEPGFLTAALAAADGAGFDLESISLRNDSALAQITWRRSVPSTVTPLTPKSASKTIREAVQKSLADRGEPAEYLTVHAAALESLARARAFHLEPHLPQEGETEPSPSLLFTQVQTAIKEALTFHNEFLRLEASEQSLEIGHWWLAPRFERAYPLTPPLSDRVEKEMVNCLTPSIGIPLIDLDKLLCASFPGLLTPDFSLVQVCLESYGETLPSDETLWVLKKSEQASARQSDLAAIGSQLNQLGTQMGFSVLSPELTDTASLSAADQPFLWVQPASPDKTPIATYSFFVLASACLGEIVLKRVHSSPGRSILVLPGSRANLVAYKLRNDPRLRLLVEKNWRLIKYRHLRWLLENTLLKPETFEEKLILDPLTYSAPQMRLL